MIALTKTAGTGQQIEVKLHEYLPGQYVAHLYLDGQYLPGHGEPQRLSTPKGAVTHCLGNSQVAVGLTSEEAATIRQAIDSANAAWRASEAGRLAQGKSEREALVLTAKGCEDEAEAAFEQLHERGDSSAAWQAKQALSPAIDAAWKAVRAFDAARPEVRAALKAEQAEALRRFEASH